MLNLYVTIFHVGEIAEVNVVEQRTEDADT